MTFAVLLVCGLDVSVYLNNSLSVDPFSCFIE